MGDKKNGGNARQGRFIARMLAVIERVGNALPHPAILFGSLAGLVVVAVR